MDSRDVLLCSQVPNIEPHDNIYFNIILPFTPRVINLFLSSVFGLNVNIYRAFHDFRA